MIRVLVVAVAVGAILTPPVATAQHINEENKTHAVSGNVRRLVLDNESGEVTIRTGNESSVTTTQRWNLARPRYRQELSNGTLTVRADCPNNVLLNNCSVDLYVVVPRGAQVDAENVTGSVRVTGFSGRPVSAEVRNGLVRLEDLRVPAVRGSTRNGDVLASLIGRPLTVRLSTTNGDVAASLPKGVYDIETATTNGEVSVSGLEDDPRSKRKLSASTTNGDVALSGN